ncbi:alpha/beta fold hydrolase [Ensifer soli]|uniref:alpha/beta fold hydrolase n=1 Tax=Ciceribacter sp. sgz301302 TaxID=3342379 RepID=UPI0035BA1155
MDWQLDHLDGATGARLAVRTRTARGEVRAILILCHGLAEHSGRYARFAEAMAGAGLAVYAFDHRGHGATTAADAPRGRFSASDGPARLVKDLGSVREWAAGRHPACPVILFGHSMGGLIALYAAEEEPAAYDGLAVWNSNLDLGLGGHAARALLGIERMLKGSDVPSTLLPALTFHAWGRAIKGARTPSDWLSRDTAEVDAYRADPLCGFDASISLWLDVVHLGLQGGRRDRLARLPPTLPVHLVGGTGDPSTDNGRALNWLALRMRDTGLRDVTCTLYPGMRHETLNEIGREQATSDFRRWCDGVIDNSRSRAERRAG